MTAGFIDNGLSGVVKMIDTLRPIPPFETIPGSPGTPTNSFNSGKPKFEMPAGPVDIAVEQTDIE